MALAGMLIASCEGAAPSPFQGILADRFDAPACRDVELVKVAGTSVPEGHKVVREFVANAACKREIARDMAELDFALKRPGVFVAVRENNWTETVTIDRPNSAKRANVIWEEINP